MGLTASHIITAPRSDVWVWHTRPGAVERLTPPGVPMTPLSQADTLADGTTRFALPAGLRWVARHDAHAYREGEIFADEFLQWRHIHEFREHPRGTEITDTVRTPVPARLLRPMFAYRQHQLVQDFGFRDRLIAAGLSEPLTIAMTGSSGLVGRALSAQLRTLGHTVIELVRREPVDGQRRWAPQSPSPDLLDGVDVLVHLAGEPIFGRFTPGHKAAIRDSRVGPTEKLAQLAAGSTTVTAMVSASAVGYYGNDGGHQPLAEDARPGEGFLAEVVSAWENATAAARKAGKRVVNIRTGIALSADSGVLPLLRLASGTGFGGPFGAGDFWMSWIALDDLTDIYVRAIVDAALRGPVNAVAPTPVLNRQLSSALGAQMRRPSVFPVPEFGPKILLGEEGARELALANQRIEAGVLRDVGHTFRYPAIERALAHELLREKLL